MLELSINCMVRERYMERDKGKVRHGGHVHRWGGHGKEWKGTVKKGTESTVRN